jgi:putative SOS response-associated peptidase YedK
MCTNYRPSAIEAMKFGALEDIRETKIPFKVEVFPNDPAPIIRPARAESENAGHLEWTPAPPMATSNSPTYGRPNSPGQDALIIS